MGRARRSVRAALPTVMPPVPWHPALVPRGAWDAPEPTRALANLHSERELLRVLVGGLAALSAKEFLGVTAGGRWLLGEDDLPCLVASDRGDEVAADRPDAFVRHMLSLFGARPGKGSERSVLPRRHAHGAALSAWSARWLEVPSGAREALVDLLEVLGGAGAEPDLPAGWGVAALWTPSPALSGAGLRRVRLTGPASRGALAAWCSSAGVRRVALGKAAPYPFASLEPLVRAALRSGAGEAQGWLAGRLRGPSRLGRELAELLEQAGEGFCLWPAESLDPSAAETLERCAPSLAHPLLLAGATGEGAGEFGDLGAVAFPRTGEVWFRLHALAASDTPDGAVEAACARPGGMPRAGSSLLPLPPADGAVSPLVPALPTTGPGAAVAFLARASRCDAEGHPDQAALCRARAHTLVGQTELAFGLLTEVKGPEADWLRARAWEGRQAFAEVAATIARIDVESLPEEFRGQARVLGIQAAWLAGGGGAGLPLLENIRQEAADPDSSALATLALATCLLLGDDEEGAQRLLAEAEALLPRCRRHIPAIVFFQRRAFLLRKRGLFEAALDSLARAAALAEEAWDHWMEAVSHLETGNVLRLLYRFDDARERLRRAEEGFLTLGLAEVRERARFDRILCDAESGNLLRAQSAFEASIARSGPGADRSVDRYWLARVLQLRGEPAPALEHVASALRDLRAHPNPEVGVPLRILEARLLLDAHQSGRLKGMLEEVGHLARSASDPDDRLDAASVLVEAEARGHGRDRAAELLGASVRGASPGARARWALARARAGRPSPVELLREARELAGEISDPALEAEALWELASRGRLPDLTPADSARLARFLSENRLRGEVRRLLPLLSPPAAPPLPAGRTAPLSPVRFLEEARQGRVDLDACAVAAGARGALLRPLGGPPLWAGALPAAARTALMEMSGSEGLVPVAGGWCLGVLGRGGLWAGFSWSGPEPPPGECASLARLWAAVLPPPELLEEAGDSEERSDPLLNRLLQGRAPALITLRRRLREAASFSFPVLLTGEPGVGKEACARALHILSPHASRPWVPANCANLSPTLAASLLFGHRKGAFTGADRDSTGLVEAARGGLLFLDEVGELPVETQAQLLRFLQDGSYSPLGETRPRHSDARVVAATNRDLERAVAGGQFRADLFHRLNVIRIDVPPLRERAEDIPLLFDHFLAEAARAEGRPVPPVAEGLWGRLACWRWPGNVRELQNLARSLLVVASSRGRVLEEDLPEPMRRHTSPAEPTGRLREHLARAERAAVAEALGRSGGNISAAARALGITRQALARKLARGISSPEARSTDWAPSRSRSPAGGSGGSRA